MLYIIVTLVDFFITLILQYVRDANIYMTRISRFICTYFITSTAFKCLYENVLIGRWPTLAIATPILMQCTIRESELCVVFCVFGRKPFLYICIASLYAIWWDITPTSRPHYWHKITIILAGITYHIHHKILGEITYAFPNFNDATVDVWQLVSNFIPHFTGHVVTYPCWDWS